MKRLLLVRDPPPLFHQRRPQYCQSLASLPSVPTISSALVHRNLTVEEARITCAIVDAAAKVRDLNFKYMAEGATVTARFGPDGITTCDPNRANEGVDKVFQRIYDRAI